MRVVRIYYDDEEEEEGGVVIVWRDRVKEAGEKRVQRYLLNLLKLHLEKGYDGRVFREILKEYVERVKASGGVDYEMFREVIKKLEDRGEYDILEELYKLPRIGGSDGEG
mgnify:CR=1 FL=1